MAYRFIVEKTGRSETVSNPLTPEQAKSKAMGMANNESSDITVEAQGNVVGGWDWGTYGLVQWRGGARRVVGFAKF